MESDRDIARRVRALEAGMEKLRSACEKLPAPQPEAKAEPDYTCPKCGKYVLQRECGHSFVEMIAAANALIADLKRERNEARDQLLKAEANAYALGWRNGAAAAKEACAKAAVERAKADADAGNPVWPAIAEVFARIVREAEVPGP